MKLPSIYDNWSGYAPPSPGITLRDYQSDAIEAVWDYMRNTSTGNPLISAPTGSGKSMILAGICHEAWKMKPGTRIMMLTHVKELIEQNEAALKSYWSDAPVGVFSAGLGRKEHEAPILFAGIQSGSRALGKIGAADFVIVDEAHLIPKKGSGQYLSVFKALRTMRPNMRVIGLTATPFRTDSGYLHKGVGKLFDELVYDIPLLELMDRGHLCRVTSKATKSRINVEGVAKSGGDFNSGQLEGAAMDGDNVSSAVDEVISRGESRKGWLFFASGRKHAEMIVDEVKRRGYTCSLVMGHTPKAERRDMIADFKAQKVRAMVSVGVLTTGFDAPHVDLIALMRPTMSPGLHVQIVGRGLRTAPEKSNCLILDFAGNIERHGPLDNIRVREPGEGDGTPPVKECPKCQELCPSGVLVCPACGHEFPDREIVKHEASPSYLAVISDDVGPAEIPAVSVQNMRTRRHQKAGKPDSLRITYTINMVTDVSEWLCFSHGDFMRRKASQAWGSLGGDMPAPESTDEAMDRLSELTPPTHLRVNESGSFPSVTDRLYIEREAGDETEDEPGPLVLGDLEDLPF